MLGIWIESGWTSSPRSSESEIGWSRTMTSGAVTANLVIYGLTAGSLARADVLVPGPLAEKAVALLFGEDEEQPDASDRRSGENPT